MTMFDPGIAQVVRRDPRYAYEAYEFVLEALTHTQALFQRVPPDDPGAAAPKRKGTPVPPPALRAGQPDAVEPGPEYHVSGRELLIGIRDLALREFGLMARTVLRLWGVNRTDDFGEMIFNLIDAGRLSKTDSDRKSDFHAVYDLDRALTEGYAIKPDGAAWPQWSER
jgi:uncharacterized repeat protein (TIGR04138 family)